MEEYTAWQVKMQKGMELIKEGCQVAPNGCRTLCPFTYYCGAMITAHEKVGYKVTIPAGWEEE